MKRKGLLSIMLTLAIAMCSFVALATGGTGVLAAAKPAGEMISGGTFEWGSSKEFVRTNEIAQGCFVETSRGTSETYPQTAGAAETVTTEKHSGAASLKIDIGACVPDAWGTEGPGVKYVFGTWPNSLMVPNGNYAFKAAVKGAAGTKLKIYMVACYPTWNENYLIKEQTMTGGSFDLIDMIYEFKASGDGDAARYELAFISDTAATFYIDDLSMQVSEEVLPVRYAGIPYELVKIGDIEADTWASEQDKVRDLLAYPDGESFTPGYFMQGRRHSGGGERDGVPGSAKKVETEHYTGNSALELMAGPSAPDMYGVNGPNVRFIFGDYPTNQPLKGSAYIFSAFIKGTAGQKVNIHLFDCGSNGIVSASVASVDLTAEWAPINVTVDTSAFGAGERGELIITSDKNGVFYMDNIAVLEVYTATVLTSESAETSDFTVKNYAGDVIEPEIEKTAAGTFLIKGLFSENTVTYNGETLDVNPGEKNIGFVSYSSEIALVDEKGAAITDATGITVETEGETKYTFAYANGKFSCAAVEGAQTVKVTKEGYYARSVLIDTANPDKTVTLYKNVDPDDVSGNLFENASFEDYAYDWWVGGQVNMKWGAFRCTVLDIVNKDAATGTTPMFGDYSLHMYTHIDWERLSYPISNLPEGVTYNVSFYAKRGGHDTKVSLYLACSGELGGGTAFSVPVIDEYELKDDQWHRVGGTFSYTFDAETKEFITVINGVAQPAATFDSLSGVEIGICLYGDYSDCDKGTYDAPNCYADPRGHDVDCFIDGFVGYAEYDALFAVKDAEGKSVTDAQFEITDKFGNVSTAVPQYDETTGKYKVAAEGEITVSITNKTGYFDKTINFDTNDIEITYPYNVTVKVVDTYGNPVSGATVTARAGTETLGQFIESATAGTYTLADKVDTEVTIVVSKNGYDFPLSSKATWDKSTITVKSRQDPPYKATVTLKDSKGNAVKGAVVKALQENEMEVTFTEVSDGVYEADVSGEVSVTVTKADYTFGSFSMDAENASKTVTATSEPSGGCKSFGMGGVAALLFVMLMMIFVVIYRKKFVR